MKLRDYQEEAVNSVFQYFQNGGTGNPIIALPTGTGKSIVIAEFIRRALTSYPQTRVIMLTHVKELIEQNAKKLLEVWPAAPVGIFSAGKFIVVDYSIGKFYYFFKCLHCIDMSFDELRRLYLGKSILNKFRWDNGYNDGTYVKV